MGKKKEKKKKAMPNNKNVYFSLSLLASEAHGFPKKKKKKFALFHISCMSLPCNFDLPIIKVRGQKIISGLDFKHLLICWPINWFLIKLRMSKGKCGNLNFKLKSLEFIAEG